MPSSGAAAATATAAARIVDQTGSCLAILLAVTAMGPSLVSQWPILRGFGGAAHRQSVDLQGRLADAERHALAGLAAGADAGIELQVVADRSEEPTSELQSLMRNSYAVFRLQKKNTNT